MGSTVLVVLVGDSLLIDSVDVSLRMKVDLKIVRVPYGVDILAWCEGQTPDMVLVELDRCPDLTSYMAQFPGVPFLGIDAASDHVVVLTAEQATVRSSEDLLKLIRRKTDHPQQVSAIAVGLPLHHLVRTRSLS